MRSRAVFLAFVLCCSESAALAAGSAADRLNAEGFSFYRQRKYHEAAGVFRRALKRDPKHALANFNLAATLGVFRKLGQVCQEEAYVGTILQYLTTAIESDPGRKGRMKSDTDFDTIRDSFGYQKLLGFSPKKPEDLKRILVGVAWNGPSPGALGPVSRLKFSEGGRLRLSRHDPESLKWKDEDGRYELDGLKINLKLGEKAFVGELGEDGTLNVPELPGPFTDDKNECSA
jgi:hypothetical protein